MDTVLSEVSKWLKEVLIGGILENLTDLFAAVNDQVGAIAGDVATTPANFSPGVFALIQDISETVILPIAGLLLTFICTYELIQMIIDHNNMANFDTFLFFKWTIKTFIAVTLISNTFDMVNRALSSGLVDAFSQAAIQNAAQEYDSLLNVNEDGIMGYIRIPKIDVELPILHGTEGDTLEHGVGHVLGSSLPVGGVSTHTVLSAHSGMASQRMFTDLDQLESGDVFYLQVLGETLAYQVDDINVVLPHESQLLQITKDVDGCTLVTCTPYGVNTHRLLVHGIRIPYEEAEMIAEETKKEEVQSTWQRQYVRGLIVGGVSAVYLLLEFLIAWIIWRRRYE